MVLMPEAMREIKQPKVYTVISLADIWWRRAVDLGEIFSVCPTKHHETLNTLACFTQNPIQCGLFQ
jgi:hypothetical protein